MSAKRDTIVRAKAPVSPGAAFLHSLLVPGLGQSELGRRYAGAGFFLVEALSLALLHRTAEDLRVARAFRNDSVPLRYDIDPQSGLARRGANGDPVVVEWAKPYYTDDLIKSRKLQYEDWAAILIFNHLISGADAYVAAQLWDLPEHVKLRAFPLSRGGIGFGVAVGARSAPR